MNDRDLLLGFLDELTKIATAYGDMPASVMKTLRGGKESTDLANALRSKGIKIPKQSMTSRIRGILGFGRKKIPPAMAFPARKKESKPSEVRLSDLAGQSSMMGPETKEVGGKGGSAMSSVFAALNRKHAALLTGFLDELAKTAVYIPEGGTTLSRALPGKIPPPGIRRSIAQASSPSIRARLKAVDELRAIRKPELAVAGRVEDLFEPESPAIRHRVAREHLAGLRARAAKESYALGVEKQRRAEQQKLIKQNKVTNVEDPHYAMFRAIAKIMKRVHKKVKPPLPEGATSPEK